MLLDSFVGFFGMLCDRVVGCIEHDGGRAEMSLRKLLLYVIWLEELMDGRGAS